MNVTDMVLNLAAACHSCLHLTTLIEAAASSEFVQARVREAACSDLKFATWRSSVLIAVLPTELKTHRSQSDSCFT